MPTTSNPYALPIFPVARDDRFEIQMEVHDLAGAPIMRVFDPETGETHHLSVDAVEKIRLLAANALRGTMLVSEARFYAHHPARDPEMAPKIRQGACRVIQYPNEAPIELGTWLMSSNEATPEWQHTPREGEPKLTWRAGSYTGDDCGWDLTLHGSVGVQGETILGFAKWNDPEGIARLVGMLEDRQSVFVVSGVMDSASTARLSSRLTALTMRKARRLPAIRLKGVREVLSNAGLIDGSGSQYTNARGRVLPIQVDEASVPVAVAIIPPQRPSYCAPFPESISTMPWHERQACVQEIEKAGREVWTARAKAALTAAGWRLIDLPLPTNQYNAWRVRQSNSSTEFFYVTRIKEDTWGEIAPAALSAAESINLNRSSIL